MLIENFFYGDYLCFGCKDISFKYTSIDDINNLIDEFVEELSNNSRQTHMYMELYEHYYDYFENNVIDIYWKYECDWNRTLKEFNCKHNIENFIDNMDLLIMNDLNNMRSIFIPNISDEINILDKRISNYITDMFYIEVYDSICELERDLTLKVFDDMFIFFSNKIKSKNFNKNLLKKIV